MPEARTYMTTDDLKQMLRARYEPASWALMFEVADATGARHSRWADCIAMGLWPSRGLCLHGHEVKAARSDWIKELRTPEKAEAICRFCDYWWLVVSDAQIVHDGELPENWGLLAPTSKGLRCVKEAPKLTPEPLSRHFLAALLRSAAKPFVANDQQRLREEYSRGYKESTETNEHLYKQLEAKHDGLKKQVRDFEQAAGFQIQNWEHKAEQAGRVVREVLAGRYNRNADDLKRMREIAAHIIERIDGSALATPDETEENADA